MTASRSYTVRSGSLLAAISAGVASVDLLLLGASLLCYAFLMLYRLDQLPIYFACDEATHAVLARRLLHLGPQREAGWPLFFATYGEYQLSASVHLQALFEWIFGPSIFTARIRNVVLSSVGLSAALCMLRRMGVQKGNLWIAPTVIAISPIWFLHTRSGFEAMLSMYALLAALVSAQRLLERPAPSRGALLACAALTWVACYAYAPARGWTALSLALLLATASARRSRKVLVLSTTALVFTPLITLAFVAPQIAFGRLLHVTLPAGSHDLSSTLATVIVNAAQSLNPLYWFLPDRVTPFPSWELHVLPGRPLLPMWLLPFTVLGAVRLVRLARRQCFARVVLCLPFIGLIPGVVSDPRPLRILPIGVAYLIFGMFGLTEMKEWVSARTRQGLADGVCVVALLCAAAAFFASTFYESMTSYRDYGFNGIQLGAQEVFERVRQEHAGGRAVQLDRYAFYCDGLLSEFFGLEEENEARPMNDFGRACPSQQEAVTWLVRPERLQSSAQLSQCQREWRVVDSISDPRQRPLFWVLQ